MARRRRLIISVQPRMLGDALSRVLESDDVEVVVHLESDRPRTEPRFDVAIVTGALPEPFTADVVIVLPEEPAGSEAITLPDLLEDVERVWAQRDS